MLTTCWLSFLCHKIIMQGVKHCLLGTYLERVRIRHLLPSCGCCFNVFMNTMKPIHAYVPQVMIESQWTSHISCVCDWCSCCVPGTSTDDEGWEALPSDSWKLLGSKNSHSRHGSAWYTHTHARHKQALELFFLLVSKIYVLVFRCDGSSPFYCSCDVLLLGKCKTVLIQLVVWKTKSLGPGLETFRVILG